MTLSPGFQSGEREDTTVPERSTPPTMGMRRAIFDADLRAEMAEAAWAGGQALPRWPDRAEAFRAEIEKAFA